MKHITIACLPVLVGLVAWGGYNWTQTGTFALTTRNNHQTFFIIRTVGFKNVFVPTTIESEAIRQLIPEVREDLYPFSVYPYYWLALYRAEALWDMSRLEFHTTYDVPATNQFLWENREFLLPYFLKWVSYDFVAFDFQPEDIPYMPYDKTLPIPTAAEQMGLGYRIDQPALQQYHFLSSKWKSEIFTLDNQQVPEFVQQYLNNDNWRLIESSFLFSGLAGSFAMLFLMVYSKNKLLPLMLAGYYFTDLTVPAFASGEYIALARFQFPLELFCLIAVLLFISYRLRTSPLRLSQFGKSL